MLLYTSLIFQSGDVQHAIVEFKDKFYTLEDVAVAIEGEKKAAYNTEWQVTELENSRAFIQLYSRFQPGFRMPSIIVHYSSNARC